MTTIERPNRRSRKRRDWVLVAVLAVIALVVGVTLALRGSGPPPAQAPTAGPAATAGGPEVGPLAGIARRVPDDPMALGRVDAPVVMVMFSDFRCPFCAKFSRDTEDQLVRDYVEPGRLRIEWRDYAIFGPQSTSAAAAGRAAAAQGRFWPFNRAVFADAPDRGHADLPDSTLRRYAEQVGVPDIGRFDRDMHSPENDRAVQADVDEASSLGVPSTPAFVINGKPMLGAQPVATFRSEIDAALGGVR